MSSDNDVKKIVTSSVNVANDIIEIPTISDILKQILRYIIEGIVVALAGYYIPNKKPELSEVITIALVAASTFALLEVYMPDAYLAARFGFGFQSGRNLIPS